jgi:hypothetical protein
MSLEIGCFDPAPVIILPLFVTICVDFRALKPRNFVPDITLSYKQSPSRTAGNMPEISSHHGKIRNCTPTIKAF